MISQFTLPGTLTRLEKAAVDSGFDLERPRDGNWLQYASTHAAVNVWLAVDDAGRLLAAVSRADVAGELQGLGNSVAVQLPSGAVAARVVRDVPTLHRLLRRSFQLARALPDAMLHAFEAASAKLPRTTEAERLVIQRVGQDVFRSGLLEYWDGKCAVTGLGVPQLLRASHIKPWAACESDAERLDVFNGLLLAPQLDAAFDAGLITVSDGGEIVVSPRISSTDAAVLGLGGGLRVTRLTEAHRAYLIWHRDRVFERVDDADRDGRGGRDR